MSFSDSSGARGTESSLTEWTLLVQQSGQQDQEVFLQHGLTIGRNASNAITIQTPGVERIHARIQRQDDGTLVVEALAGHAPLLTADGEPVTRLPIAPEVLFRIGPASITCRQRPTRPTVIVTQNPWQVRCPGCLEPLVETPRATRKCPACSLPLLYFRSSAAEAGQQGFEGWVPLQVGTYRVRAFAGQGGMGVVLRGVHDKTDLPAALKLLHTDLAEQPNWRARFDHEIETLQGLRHRHLAHLQDHGQDGHLVWLAVDWVEGLPLSRLLAKAAADDRAMPIRRIADVLGQVAAGLEYLHARSIVHRDLKPANVLVAADGLVRLTDFGIARATTQHTQATGLTQTGTVLGTAGYMSPEQAEGGLLTPASDVYSFGVLWRQLLTGRRPVGPVDRDVRRSDCPPGWKRLIRSCLAECPSQRPTIHQIQYALQNPKLHSARSPRKPQRTAQTTPATQTAAGGVEESATAERTNSDAGFDYAKLRFYRRNGAVSAMLLISLALTLLPNALRSFWMAQVDPVLDGLCFSLALILLVVVCVCVLTGPVYFNKRTRAGDLRSWHWLNKVAAVLLIVPWIALVILALSSGFNTLATVPGLHWIEGRPTQSPEWKAWVANHDEIILADEQIMLDFDIAIDKAEADSLEGIKMLQIVQEQGVERYQREVLDRLEELAATCPPQYRAHNEMLVDYANAQFRVLQSLANLMAGLASEEDFDVAIRERDRAQRRFMEDSIRILRENE